MSDERRTKHFWDLIWIAHSANNARWKYFKKLSESDNLSIKKRKYYKKQIFYFSDLYNNTFKKIDASLKMTGIFITENEEE